MFVVSLAQSNGLQAWTSGEKSMPEILSLKYQLLGIEWNQILAVILEPGTSVIMISDD
jgi:hypothetical protein